LFIALQTGWSAGDAVRHVTWRNLAASADGAVKAGGKPTEEQAEAKSELDAERKRRKPSPEDLEKDARQWRGNPWEVIVARAKAVADWHRVPYYDPVNLDIWSMMFIGMGLYKLGVVLSAAARCRTLSSPAPD
jgi:hypothetical protein